MINKKIEGAVLIITCPQKDNNIKMKRVYCDQ